jgi:hypothetical protein
MLTAAVLPGSMIAQTQVPTEQVIFRISGCLGTMPRSVNGYVPQGIDLSNDETTMQILEKAVHFAQLKCPQKYPFGDITVLLFQKDRRGFNILWVSAHNYDANKLTWPEYKNRARESRLAQEKKAEEEKKRLELKEAARRGEEGQEQVVFSIITCGEMSFDSKKIRCDVPQGIDLGDEKKTHSILEEAGRFAKEKCLKERYATRIYLYQSSERYPGQYKDDYVVTADLTTWGNKFHINYYENKIVKKRLEEEQLRRQIEEKLVAEERRRQEEERKRIEMETIKAKEEKERQEALKRLNEFVSKYGVKEWPSSQALYANPFVYEGKTIAIFANFSQMVSPTQGYFLGADSKSGDFDLIVVSDIPKGLFTSKTLVILACRVLGKTEVKVPLFGGTASAPHLKFVGVYICKDWGCKDILPTKKK